MSTGNKRHYSFYFLLIAAVLFWGMAVAGAFLSYSPIPYSDMWDGYLDFYIKASEGDWSVWWNNHNEHRIVISRIFFWVDLAYLKGSVWFLLALNYALLAISCLVFWRALKEKCPQDHRSLGLFVVIWLSSWSQHENLTWGFQSQFILAQLLPLAAFFMLHKAAETQTSNKLYFIAACALGVLSLGSMANGIMALPLMTAYGLVTHLSRRRVLLLGSLASLGLIAYFYNYHPPSHHGSLIDSLRNNPVGLTQFILNYLGSPFFYIFGGKAGKIIAPLAGGWLIASSVYLAWRSLASKKTPTLDLALLTFILYIGGTALGTAGGRLIFGVEQALVNRYATPALMAWAALFVLISPKLMPIFDKHPWKYRLPVYILVLAMLPLQLKALRSKTDEVFNESIAGLAIEMGINDQQKIQLLYPSASRAISIGKAASEKGLSYYSRPEYSEAKDIVGKQIINFSGKSNICQGSIDFVEPIESEIIYMRIGGWIFNQSEKTSPRAVLFLNENSIVFGYGLVGQPRNDIGEAIGTNASRSGFKGYFLSDAQGSSVTVLDPINHCRFSSKIPAKVFHLTEKN